MKTYTKWTIAILGLAMALAHTPQFALAAGGQDGRIKVEKSKDKDLKRGTIEIKNDTGKDCNDFHIFFKPSVPTIEKIKVKESGKDPFPSGYRIRGTQAGAGDPWADFGRQKGDGTVAAGDTVVIEIAWKDPMPEIAGYAWTLDGNVLQVENNGDKQSPEIKGKAADAVRKAKADAEAKAKKEAEKRAAEEEKAKEKAAADEEKAKKKAEKGNGIQKSVAPGGLQTAEFETVYGTVKVLLPDDIRAGDTITGTVVAEPVGASEAERTKNADVLQGYVVSAEDDASGKESDSTLTFKVTAAAGAFLWLRGTNGKSVGGPIRLPVNEPLPGVPVLRIPAAGQGGRPLRIQGPFDPARPTEVRIGEQPARVLAESPRAVFVEMPRAAPGPQNIVVLEDGRTLHEGRISTVQIRLSTAKPMLLKGESTTLKVRVEGLLASYAGDRLEVYFDPAYSIIQNNSPDVIEFFGPGSEPFNPILPPSPKPTTFRSVKITKDRVSPDGVFETSLNIRAKREGGFSLSSFFCLEGDFDSISRPTVSRNP